MGRPRITILFSVASAICFTACLVQVSYAADAVGKTKGAAGKAATATTASFNDKAWQELNGRNFRRAIRAAEQWLASEPESAPAYYVKGKAHAEIGEKDRAIEAFSRAIKLDPKMDIAYRDRGWLFYMKNRYREAERDFSALIAITPTAAAYTSRAYANAKLGNTKAVIADATRSIQLDPKDMAAYQLRANAYLKVGPYEDSAADWRKAIALAPKAVGLREGLAMTLTKSSEHEMVVEEVTKAFNSGVSSAELYRLRADAFYKLEEYQKCADDLTVLLARTKDPWIRWDFLKLRGRCYLRSKQYAKAEKDCTDAIAVAIDDSKTYYCRADVREHMGKYKEAIQDLTLTLKYDPNNGRAYSMRANVYEHLGEKAKAASDRQSAIKLGDKQWGI